VHFGSQLFPDLGLELCRLDALPLLDLLHNFGCVQLVFGRELVPLVANFNQFIFLVIFCLKDLGFVKQPKVLVSSC
jgi:hypothetical protein